MEGQRTACFPSHQPLLPYADVRSWAGASSCHGRGQGRGCDRHADRRRVCVDAVADAAALLRCRRPVSRRRSPSVECRWSWPTRPTTPEAGAPSDNTTILRRLIEAPGGQCRPARSGTRSRCDSASTPVSRGTCAAFGGKIGPAPAGRSTPGNGDRPQGRTPAELRANPGPAGRLRAVRLVGSRSC